MVKNCSFNDYHHDFTHELESSLLHLSACQSNVISSLLLPSAISRQSFSQQMDALQDAFKALRSAYISARLHRIEHVLQSATTIQSEDSLSHAFFLFHLEAIVRLLTQLPTRDRPVPPAGPSKKCSLKVPWPRLVSSLKYTIIIAIGSIFVLVPSLSKAFENGHLILITLCVTQGDTVGGALTTMKMRLAGTLLGKTIRSASIGVSSSVSVCLQVRSGRTLPISPCRTTCTGRWAC